DVCRGYYDVMGHFDSAFNCSKDEFIFCCGTCHYRFCCQDRGQQLEQENCKNYYSPDWAKPQTDTMLLPDDSGDDPDFDPLKQQSHNTGFVIGGVIVFMVAVAVGIKVVFNKVQQEAHQRDLNMPSIRALVDMLRHQSSPVQQDERNNSVALAVGDPQGTLGRPPKNLYAPGLPSKDNRSLYVKGPLNWKLPDIHFELITLCSSCSGQFATQFHSPIRHQPQTHRHYRKHNNTKSQPAFHHSLHNLAQLPPSYESATKPELNRYSSLKRLAQPALQSSQHHLHWGGDYTLNGRGTLPRHAIRPWIPPQPSGMPASPTPNPYPLDPPEPHYNPNYDTLSKPQRKVKPNDQLLNITSNISTTKPWPPPARTPTHRPSPGRKAQSQQNVCATPSLDRHHMIKMNSHPTSGREQGVVMGTGTLGGHSARRMAFAAKRQNTIEQLHFIPGGGGVRTGSKNEVTV
uniref:Shisa family member 7a n=1 Tax=Gasterosteus aculeatus TaxID=69293 RepID=G3P955_GASAC